MILLFVVSVVAVVLILYLGKGQRSIVRVAWVVLALSLINLPTLFFLLVGDKPLPGARTVTHEAQQKAVKQ